MGITHQQRTPDLETWERFKSARGQELQNWVDVEHALAQARRAGSVATDPGDRLLAAEAALQSAIVDFAAAQDADSDPTPVALGLLRLAEDALEADEHGPRPTRNGRRRPAPDRRRSHRAEA
jgi:hypothetical protein